MEQVTARFSVVALVAYALMSVGIAPAAEMRTWRYRESGEAFRAQLVRVADGQLHLRLEDQADVLAVDSGKLSMADLVYAYEYMQRPAPPVEPVAPSSDNRAEEETSPPATTDDMEPEPAAPPGECEVQIEWPRPIDRDDEQRITQALLEQLASYGPFPEGTTTSIQLKLILRNEKVIQFRLGKYAFTFDDKVALCQIVIERNNPKVRRGRTMLHKGNLQIAGVDELAEPPTELQPAITDGELEDILHRAAIDAICAWQIPDEVFAK